MAAEREAGLAAYTDRLSGRPGDVVRFQVSSSSGGGRVKASLTRCTCADPNPDGPGRAEEDASEWFEPREFEGRRQAFRGGSHARSRDAVRAPHGTESASVEVWMCPSRIVRGKENSDEAGANASQCVWTWGGLGLYLMANGLLAVDCGKGMHSVEPNQNLLPNRWYHCRLTISLCDAGAESGSGNDWRCELVVVKKDRISKEENLLFSAKVCPKTTADRSIAIPIGAHFELASGGTFNGRLEDPAIMVGDRPLVRWDSSEAMTEWSIPSDRASIQHDNPLLLHNHPTRAVRGRRWDGTQFDWRHAPRHYGGVHFHDDDLYDFGWESDFEWTIPEGTPSGIYVARLVDERGEEEALPLFVCPSLEGPAEGDIRRKKKVCILVSTFTYGEQYFSFYVSKHMLIGLILSSFCSNTILPVMYGNHARADFQPSWLDRIKDWKAYPRNPSQYRNYGLSTYNFHSDGSGICFASHLRPLFNVRPGYLTFGDSACSGLRHFPADTHLIAWMHHFDVDYDIVTDHELHNDGVACIAGYPTLVTGTHPEYHTLESLNALQEFRDVYGGNLVYLGGNGFYWRVAAKEKDASILEIRRAEDGVRTWASDPGEYHHMLDGGSHGGLWRRNDRPPQQLVGVGFTAQGSFVGMPYKRVCFRPELEWLFEGIHSDELGGFGYSGNGAAGFELDRTDQRLDGCEHEIIILAQSFDKYNEFMLVPEEVLTTYSNLSGITGDEARRSDMVYFRTKSGSQVFSVGSITFCGSLPWNDFKNNVSVLLGNVIRHFSLD